MRTIETTISKRRATRRRLAQRRLNLDQSRAAKFAPKQMNALISARYSRRKFITSTAAASLLAGLPTRWAGSVFASDAPETSQMKFGMIALTDCSPIVIAHEKGIFKKYGID